MGRGGGKTRNINGFKPLSLGLVGVGGDNVVSRVVEQLKVRFTAHGSMRSIGWQYRSGLLVKYGLQFAKQSVKDPLFLLQFIYLLGIAFQWFCKEMLRLKHKWIPTKQGASTLH